MTRADRFVAAPGAIHRPLALAALACAFLAGPLATRALAAPARAAAPAAPASKLVILSTSDVTGKNQPCGCRIPKGGLARRAAFVDSLRRLHPQLLVVDAGGFFPEYLTEERDAGFMSQAMSDLGVNAAGVGQRELRFGLGFLLATAANAKLPLVCANLLDRETRRPLVKPSLVLKSGRARVGVFGLLSDKVPTGPAGDSLVVTDPVAAAREAVAALRAQGASVIVLLAALGKIGTEELVAEVGGIDVAIVSWNAPLVQSGRVLDKTTLVLGGEQGQYVGLTELALDAGGRPVSATSEAVMLGPYVSDQPAMLAKVKAYEARPEVMATRAAVADAPAGADSSATHSH